MIRSVTGSTQDAAGDWVAHLSCGHAPAQPTSAMRSTTRSS